MTIEDVIEDQILRRDLHELEARVAAIKLRLVELNRPAYIDAKAVIAELEAREEARRRKPATKVEAKAYVGQTVSRSNLLFERVTVNHV